METSPQMSDETQMVHNCFESHMETWLLPYHLNIRIQTGHRCLESHMETSPQMSDETQTVHNCLESHMETSAQSSDKNPIPL